MADAITLRVGNCEDECEELKKRVDANDERLDDTSDRVLSLEYWKKGNGARGAEIRLQDTEAGLRRIEDIDASPRLNVLEAEIKTLQNIADAKITEVVTASVHEALNLRDKTAIAYLKAAGPYAAAVAAIAVAILKMAK